MGWDTPYGSTSQEDAAIKVAINRSKRAKDYRIGLKYIETWSQKWGQKGANCEYVKNQFIEWANNDELRLNN